jgi:hypothetical protein
MDERTPAGPLIPVACMGMLLLLFGVCGCGSSRTLRVSVPPVDTTVLDIALKRLAAAHLRVQLTDFGPLPAGYELGSADVGDQDPEAATRVEPGSVVRLDMHGPNPIPSPAVPIRHPPTVTTPMLVGLTWPAARRAVSPGYWLVIGHVPALGPHDPDDVYCSYVVIGQSPTAGTKLPFGGVTVSDGGFRPTVVQLQIGRR